MSATLTDERALGPELLEILWSAYLLRHHSTGSEDPVEAMRSLKVLHLLSDDLVLRLCKLRDPDDRSLSLHWALKVVREKRLPTTQAKAIKKRITEYGRAMGNLTELRNKQIAHKQTGHSWTLGRETDIARAIKRAVEITDDLLGERCAYVVAGLDLRTEVLGNHDAA